MVTIKDGAIPWALTQAVAELTVRARAFGLRLG
jgi:hypothetical protein